MSLYKNNSDKQLVDLLVIGNEEAFSELYSRYWKRLFERAYVILQDEAIAKDAVQDVFISLWKRRESLEILHLNAYLQKAIRFKVLHFIRAERTDSEFYNRLKKVTTEIIADDPVLFKEQQGLLADLINSLPDDWKEAFLLSREEDMTYKQIAEELNVSIKTVEKRISKALKYLRQQIDLEF